MTYRAVWSENLPDGSEDADEIETYIQDVRRAIADRMATILGADGNWSTDPVIPTGYDLTTLRNGVKSVANVERTLGWYNGYKVIEVGTVAYQNTYISVTGVNGEFGMIVPVSLPVGVTITQVRARVYYAFASHTIDGTFFGISDAATNYSQTLSAPTASAAPQWMSASSLTHVTLADNHYGFNIRADNNNTNTGTDLRLYSVQVYYTHPGGALR